MYLFISKIRTALCNQIAYERVRDFQFVFCLDVYALAGHTMNWKLLKALGFASCSTKISWSLCDHRKHVFVNKPLTSVFNSQLKHLKLMLLQLPINNYGAKYQLSRDSIVKKLLTTGTLWSSSCIGTNSESSCKLGLMYFFFSLEFCICPLSFLVWCHVEERFFGFSSWRRQTIK